MEVQGKKYCTIRETKRLTGIPENYLRRLAKDGKIPGFKSGNVQYVNVDKLLELMENGGEAASVGIENKEE